MASLVLDFLAPRDDRTRCCLYRCVNGARAALALVSHRGTKRHLLSNWLLPGRCSYGCFSCHLGGMPHKMFVLIDRCNGQSAWQSVILFSCCSCSVIFAMVSHHCAAVDMFAPALVLLDIFHIRASAKEGCRRINADEVAGLVAGAEAAAAAANAQGTIKYPGP